MFVFLFLFLFLFGFRFVNVHFICLWFYLDSYFLTSGASSPEWVKPTAEGGGLFAFLCFYVCLQFTMLSYWFLLRVCIFST
jgi:hypothetical protein